MNIELIAYTVAAVLIVPLIGTLFAMVVGICRRALGLESADVDELPSPLRFLDRASATLGTRAVPWERARERRRNVLAWSGVERRNLPERRRDDRRAAAQSASGYRNHERRQADRRKGDRRATT